LLKRDDPATLRAMDFPLLVAAVLLISAVTVVLAYATGAYAWCATVGSALILLLHSRIYFDYQSDDAYISFRYARNLADGIGPVWNRGERVEGYSNFLWMVLLAATRKLSLDTVDVARWSGFALSVAAGAGAYLLARKLLPGVSGRVSGVIAALLLSACGPWAVWAMAGLEGPLLATLLLAAVLLHLREQERRGFPVSGAVWALVAMTRPDGVLFFGITAAFKLADVAFTRRPGSTDAAPGAESARAARGGELLRFAVWGAGFALLFVPYFAWRFNYYGWLFPNTYYAKVGSGLIQYDRGLTYFAQFSRNYGAPLLLLAPAAIALTSIKRAPALYVGALAAGWMAYVVYIGGDALLQFRLLQPILPLFYVLISCSAAALVDGVRSDQAPPRAVRAAALALVAGGFIAFTLQPSVDSFRTKGAQEERNALRVRREIGEWLHGNVPNTTVIALVPAGTVPYVSQLPTIDLLGLNDEHIAHRDLPLGLAPSGHEKYDSDYVLDRKPEIIIVFDGLTLTPINGHDYAVVASLIPAV
jgi:arabinofuranosyltransferase